MNKNQQVRYNRRWAARNFVSGGTEVIDLPIGMDLESILFYFAGNIVIGTGYTTCKGEGLGKLIKKIDLLMDGKTIATMNGEMLTHANFARQGGLIKVNPGVTVTTHAAEVVGFLDLANIGGLRPKDSSLATRGARQLQLFIQWGTFADMFTGAGAVTSNTLQLGISTRETKEPVNGPAPEVQRLFRFFEKAYTASTVDRIPLDPNVLYRGIVLRAETVGEASGAVLNRATVQVGSDVIFDLPRAELIDVNTQDYGFALPAGYYVIDFASAPNGLAKIADYLDLHGHSDAFLVLDVTGAATTKVQVLAHEFDWLENAIEQNRSRKG